jgi:hypothetical protein
MEANNAPKTQLRDLLLATLLSGTVVSAVLGFAFHRTSTQISKEIENQFEQKITLFRSNIVWKEKSLSELLGPVYMQLDRTKRAFRRWEGKNIYLETKIIRDGNSVIRDLLLSKGHLIPPDLLAYAAELVEHYDRWLEEFEKVRGGKNPDLKTPFVFVGPEGYPFPEKAARHFSERFESMWKELYDAK